MTGLSGKMSLDSKAVQNAAIEKAFKEAFSGSTSVSGPPVLDDHLLKTYPSLWDAPFIPKSQFIFVRPIGEGSFGRVYKGILYDQDVAIKELTVKNFVDQLGERANSFGSRDLDDVEAHDTNDTARISEVLVALEREVAILRNLRHQKIVMFLGVCLEPPCIITEYCQKGSLYALLARARERPEVAKRMTWKMRIKLALDAAIGMNFLHGRNIPVLHRDLKTPNLLVDEYWNCKVADFNTSRFIDPSCVTSSISANNPRWLAPEVLEGEHHTKASDVYPFGLILWEILTWRTPWEAEAMGTFQIFNCVVNQNLRPEIPDDFPGSPCPFFEEYKELMTQCWDKDPDKRPGYPEIVQRLSEFKKQLEAKPAPQKPVPRPPVTTPDPPPSPRLDRLVANPFKSPPSSPKGESSSAFMKGQPSIADPNQGKSPFHEGPRFSRPVSPSMRPENVPEQEKTEDAVDIPKQNVTPRSLPDPGHSTSPSSRKAKSPPSFAHWSSDIASKSLPKTNAKVHWKNLKALLLPDLEKKAGQRLSEKWEMLRNVVVSDMVQQGTDMGMDMVMETVIEEGEEDEAAAGDAPVAEAVDPTPENHPNASNLVRKNSKWGIVRDVFGSQTLEEERHPGWTMLKNILVPEVEAKASTEPEADQPPSPDAQDAQPEDQAAEAAEELVPPKPKSRSKWEVLRHILFSDDVPRNPGWDVVQQLLLAAPSNAASTMPSISEDEIVAKPALVAGKRWAKLKEVFVSEEPDVKPKRQPSHPGWQVIMEVMGGEVDSAASSRNTSRRSSQTSGSGAFDQNEAEVALAQIQATESGQTDTSRNLRRLPSKAERYWSFLRHMMSNDESSLLVRHWDFLNTILNEQKASPPSTASSESSGSRVLKSPASKRWKKVRDLLIVDYNPPSREKWNFLREWLMRDDELGEDWEDLRAFARERVEVPEGGDWDLFRTLFFEDRGVRTHPHWAFLKDLLVKDATPTSAMPEADEFPVVAAVNPKKVRDFVLEKPEPPSKSRWSMVRTLFMDENAKPENVRETVLDLDANKPPEQSKWDEIRDLLSVGSGISST